MNAMKKVDPNLAAMCDAHCRGDVDAVRKLLEAHPQLENMGPDNYNSWLHWAAEQGQIGAVEFWLDRGWDVNLNRPGYSQAEGSVTALHVAKDAVTTRYLLSRGALVNACHRDIGVPLHHAITRVVEPSQKGRRRPDGANMDQIRALLEAGADLTLMCRCGEKKGYTPLAWAMLLCRKTAEQVLREAGAPEKGRRPFGRRAKVKTLDLQRDFADIYSYLAERVRGFDVETHEGLGGPGPVKLIEIGYEYSQAGWVIAVFDTRPDAEPDGEWTRELDNESTLLQRPHWVEAGEFNLEAPIAVIGLQGITTTLAAGSELAQTLGDLLKAVVIKARADGMFTALSKANGCELGIEHFSGEYGWPEYEARGQENLA